MNYNSKLMVIFLFCNGIGLTSFSGSKLYAWDGRGLDSKRKTFFTLSTWFSKSSTCLCKYIIYEYIQCSIIVFGLLSSIMMTSCLSHILRALQFHFFRHSIFGWFRRIWKAMAIYLNLFLVVSVTFVIQTALRLAVDQSSSLSQCVWHTKLPIL